MKLLLSTIINQILKILSKKHFFVLLKIGLIIFFVSACSTYKSLFSKINTEDPRAIVWIYVPGFDVEHFELLLQESSKKGEEVAMKKDAFELLSPDCFGQLWQYSPKDQTPEVKNSALMQMTGVPYPEGLSEDSQTEQAKEFFWHKLKNYYFETLVYERFVNEKSFQDYSWSFLPKTTKDTSVLAPSFWVSYSGMKPNVSKHFFHFQKKFPYKDMDRMDPFFDETCVGEKKECYSDIFQMIKFFVASFFFPFQNKVLAKRAIVVKDFSYLDAIMKNKRDDLHSKLKNLEKTFSFLRQLRLLFPQITVLFSSSNALSLKNINKKRPYNSLSPIMAWGPRAKNFCGIKHQSRIIDLLFLKQ